MPLLVLQSLFNGFLDRSFGGVKSFSGESGAILTGEGDRSLFLDLNLGTGLSSSSFGELLAGESSLKLKTFLGRNLEATSGESGTVLTDERSLFLDLNLGIRSPSSSGDDGALLTGDSSLKLKTFLGRNLEAQSFSKTEVDPWLGGDGALFNGFLGRSLSTRLVSGEFGEVSVLLTGKGDTLVFRLRVDRPLLQLELILQLRVTLLVDT